METELTIEAEIERLPVDLLAHIFSFILSFKDLAHVSAVCRKWRRGVKESLSRKERLSFAGWKVDDESAARVVRTAYNIKELDISRSCWGCQITDEGLYKISLTKCVGNLLSISMWGMAGITDRGVIQLVTKANSLQHLNVGGTFITDESLYAVANSCPQIKVSCRLPFPFSTPRFSPPIMEMDLTPTIVNARGFLLRVQARLMIHQRPTTDPRQLTARFRRRTASDEDASSGGFTVSLPFSLVDHRRTLEREAQAMFTRLLGDDVGVGLGRPELRIMVASFCAYTVMACSILRVGGTMRISSEVVIADSPPAVLADLPEINGALGRPPTSRAVEALEMVLADQAAGSCVICLEDFEVAARLLVMPCRRHRFHEACLREWLQRSDRCPLCRFSL